MLFVFVIAYTYLSVDSSVVLVICNSCKIIYYSCPLCLVCVFSLFVSVFLSVSVSVSVFVSFVFVSICVYLCLRVSFFVGYLVCCMK